MRIITPEQVAKYGKLPIISFGWTAAALVAERKTVTRRSWKPRTRTAMRKVFMEGRLIKAYNHVPFCKKRIEGEEGEHFGRCIGLIRLTKPPKIEPLSAMPDSDFEAEGFAYLAERPELVPKSSPITFTREGFDAWRQSGGAMCVVRFELVALITLEDQ